MVESVGKFQRVIWKGKIKDIIKGQNLKMILRVKTKGKRLFKRIFKTFQKTFQKTLQKCLQEALQKTLQNVLIES